MAVSGQLSIGRQAGQCVGFQVCAVIVKISENLRLEDKEAAINPTLTDLRFFYESYCTVTVQD